MTDVSSGNVVVGTPVTLSTVFRVAGVPTDAIGDKSCVVVNPLGAVTIYTTEITHLGTGQYTLSIIPDVAGIWHWRYIIDGQSTDEGTFTAETEFAGVSGTTVAPPDLKSLRVMVPRARRICEGPYGPPTARPPLLDSQLYAMVADGCADIILYSGNLFGHQLVVAERDPLAGFPTEWATEVVLDEWEVALITTQVGLNYFMFVLRDLRTSESIANEGTTWDYELSANVLSGYLKELQTRRNLALTALMMFHPVLERYASNIRIRDQATVAVLEWWDRNSPAVSGGSGMGGGQEALVVPWVPGWSG